MWVSLIEVRKSECSGLYAGLVRLEKSCVIKVFFGILFAVLFFIDAEKRGYETAAS